MKDRIYLVISPSGVRKLAKRPPTTNGDEVVVSLQISVPDEVFEEYIPHADIEIPMEAVDNKRFDMKISEFSTDDLIATEKRVIEVLVERPDCPEYLKATKEDKAGD